MKSLLLSSAALVLAGFAAAPLAAQTAPAAPALASAVTADPAPKPLIGKPEIGTWGVDLAGGDPSVKPGDDWVRYTAGHWAQTGPLVPAWLALTITCSVVAAYQLVQRTESLPVNFTLVVIWAPIFCVLNVVLTFFTSCTYLNLH